MASIEDFYRTALFFQNLGRLTLSTIDGLNLFTGKMDEATHFGGRGFSIWKTSDMSLVFDSGDEIEKELANSMKVVFNTDCIRNTITYQGPENLRDTQSDDYVSTPAKQMVVVILGQFTSLRQRALCKAI